MAKNTMIAAGLVCAFLSLSACASNEPRIYRGASVEGRVLDADTNKPVEGAIVVIDWRLEGGIHQDIVGRLLIREAVTDTDGRYAFPAWGPLEAKKGKILTYVPRLHLFKRGYIFKTVGNDRATYAPLPDPLTSDHNGKTIELIPFHGTISEYCHKFSGYTLALLIISAESEPCEWEQYPRMSAEFMNLEKIFQREKLYCGLPFDEALIKGGKCQNPNHVLRGLDD